ncbi:MAG: hypothetical protein H6739_28815 [Alphaproteobacteria bacterium]|nr:hypothetical protein [Alphaproteobacteria bacterium]
MAVEKCKAQLNAVMAKARHQVMAAMAEAYRTGDFDGALARRIRYAITDAQEGMQGVLEDWGFNGGPGLPGLIYSLATTLSRPSPWDVALDIGFGTVGEGGDLIGDEGQPELNAQVLAHVSQLNNELATWATWANAALNDPTYFAPGDQPQALF